MIRYRTSLPCCALLLALAFVGCSSEPTPPVPPPVPDADPAEELPVLLLDFEGFRVVNPVSGSARPLPFETPWEQTVAAVTRLQGEPAEQGALEECGAGPLTYVSWADGLTLYGAHDQFAGWRVFADTAGAYTTMLGLGVGSTRAEMEEFNPVSVEETTLGTEFATGDLFGFLSGDGPDDSVTELWAGVSCYFR